MQDESFDFWRLRAGGGCAHWRVACRWPYRPLSGAPRRQGCAWRRAVESFERAGGRAGHGRFRRRGESERREYCGRTLDLETQDDTARQSGGFHTRAGGCAVATEAAAALI